MQRNEPSQIKSVETAFRVIEALRTLDGAGTSEVARHLDMPKSTVHDHLRTLERTSHVVSDGQTYRIGPRFLDYGGYARKQMKIFQVAEPEIQELALETGQHANLMVEDHGKGVFLYKAIGEHAVQLDTYEGMRVHLQTTSLGKAILAFLPEARVESILDRHGFPAITENTLTDEAALWEALEAIREQGYASDDEERVRGMRCVGAPIIHEDTVVGAVSVSGPTSFMQGERFTDEIPQLVQGTANVIEVNLAYS